MPSIVVADAGKGKFKVMVNYIQKGISYSSKEVADKEAQKIRAEYERMCKK